MSVSSVGQVLENIRFWRIRVAFGGKLISGEDERITCLGDAGNRMRPEKSHPGERTPWDLADTSEKSHSHMVSHLPQEILNGK